MASPKVERAISLVKELIQSGQIRPGDQLPNEGDLSVQLGVSRNSLREAVRAMQTMRILEARQGDGTYVSDLDPAGMVDILRFAVDVSDARSVAWFLEIRRILEVAAVQEATARRTAAQLIRLKEIHHALLAQPDAEESLRLDGRFHDVLAEIGGNPIHAALLRVVSAPTLRARIWRQRLADYDFARVRTEHQAILDAVEAQDIEHARNAMWNHVNHVIEWVRANPAALSQEMVKQ